MTHLCVLTANYLTSVKQRRTAVIEWNGHGDFERIERICRRRERTVEKKKKSVFKALGVTYYKQGEACTLAGCMDGTFDEIVIDFGEATRDSQREWQRCQVKMVTAALGEWQLEEAFGMMEQGERQGKSWVYLAAFGSEWTRKEIERRLGLTVYRIPFSADAFRIDKTIMKWFQGIL